MAVRRLHNEDWGFESNCFVCEPKNERGLAVPFHHDEDGRVVTGEYALDEAFSGAPSYLHGGVTLAIMDEAMAWAAIAVGGKFAVTQETSARFLHPCRVGRSYRVEARLKSQDDERIEATAAVLDEKNRPCAEAEATFLVLSAAAARSAIGAELTEREAGFVKGD